MPKRIGTLANIWTFPVKSLRAVPHDAIAIERDGLAGDRQSALFVATGEHARSGKTYRGKEDNRLHLLTATDAALRAAAERGVDVRVRNGERYFDSGTVSLIFDRWIADLEAYVGYALEPLRFRPNLYARAQGGIPSEPDVVGTRVEIGEVLLKVVRVNLRCVTTTYDQETGESDPAVLRELAQRRDNVMGVYCDVERTGTVRAGDALLFR